MKQLSILLVFLAFGSGLSGQGLSSCDYEIQGTILDAETKEALPFVQVAVSGSQQVALTDLNGKFHIKELCDTSSTLLISCLGYCDTTCQHHHHIGENQNIYLKQEVNILESVTISAERAREEGTESIAQLSLGKEQLSANVTQSLASALSDIDGVTFTSVGSNVQLPVIHGLYGNRVLILNNGIKHGFQNWGTDHAPEIDIASASRITVLKGAAGVRYGPEALGGAIVVEADPLNFNQAFRANIGTGYQTNGRGYFANAGMAQGGEKLSYHLGANYTRIGDRSTPDYVLTNSGKEERAINGGLRYRLNENLDVKVYYSYLSQNLGILRSSIAETGESLSRALSADVPNFIRPFSYDINEPRQFIQHHLGKIETSWRYAEDAKLTFRIGTQLNQREEYDVRRNSELPIIDLDLVTNDFQLEWEHPEFLGLDGLVGFQVFTQNNDNNPGTRTTAFIPNYNSFRASAFFVESFKTDKNTFELGFRFDYENNDVRGRELNQNLFTDNYNFANVTASLGYVRSISAKTTFRTNLAMAWRTPNMAELFSFGQHGFRTSFGLLRYYFDESEGGRIRTNRVTPLEESNVAPESGLKWINEWKTRQEASTITVTAYTHYIQNFIYDRPLALINTIRGPMPVFIHDQADALFVGTDISWQKDWSNSVNGTLGVSLLWSQNIEDDEPLINQPPFNINYQLAWKIPSFWRGTSSRLSIKPSYTFEQFQAPRTVRPQDLIDGTAQITSDSEIFDFRDAPEGYFLLDIGWQFKSRRIDVGLSVQNVFNARYRNYLNEMRYFADEPGINFLLNINYSLNSKSE